MSYYYKAASVREAARGNWLFILAALAPDLEPALKKPGRHVRCPMHGGKSDFRLFKDAHLTGGAVCTCGAWHDGMALLMALNHWDFKRALNEVGDAVGADKIQRREQSSKPIEGELVESRELPETSTNVVTIHQQPRKPWLVEMQAEMERRLERERIYSAQLHDKIAKRWAACVPYSNTGTTPMRRYFKHREIVPCQMDEVEKSDCLRFTPSMAYYDEDGNKVGNFPAIVCAIRDVDGNLVTLHRTYLTRTGKKARVPSAKKMMPIPDGMDVNGAAIRLGEPTEGILGVAEGLETALSAYRATRIPVWSTVNATLLESFEVPDGVHTVLIWADKDKSLTGERSANVLKARLQEQGIKVYVLRPKLPIPPREKGIDWNDILLSQGKLGFPDPHYLRNFIARDAVVNQ